MALPGGLYIGQPVQYLPNIFDTGAWNNGKRGPVAALITDIDSPNNKISLVVFPKGKGPLFRTEIEYFTDTVDDENGFKLSSDALTCGAEKTGYSVTNTDASNFVIEWDALAGTSFQLFYKVNGTAEWRTPGQPGNAVIEDETETSITLGGLTGGTTYDFLLHNVCNNGVISTGVTFTETAVSPP